MLVSTSWPMPVSTGTPTAAIRRQTASRSSTARSVFRATRPGRCVEITSTGGSWPLATRRAPRAATPPHRSLAPARRPVVTAKSETAARGERVQEVGLGGFRPDRGDEPDRERHRIEHLRGAAGGAAHRPARVAAPRISRASARRPERERRVDRQHPQRHLALARGHHETWARMRISVPSVMRTAPAGAAQHRVDDRTCHSPTTRRGWCSRRRTGRSTRDPTTAVTGRAPRLGPTRRPGTSAAERRRCRR